jgi:hypothetical protein
LIVDTAESAPLLNALSALQKGNLKMSKSKTFIASATNELFAATVTISLDALSIARDSWEKNEYKSATDSLYGLLSQTYSVYEQLFIDATDEDRKTLRNSLAAKLKADGVKVQLNTTTLSLLIRYVFKSDRKRVMRYRYAIEAAKSHAVNAAGLTAWLYAQGGIDAVAKLIAPSEETIAKREKIAAATTDLNSLMEQRKLNPLASVKINGVAAKTRTVFIAEPSLNGTFNIVCVVEDVADGLYGGLVKCAAAQYSASNDESLALQREAEKFITTESASNDSIEQKAA